MFTENTVSTSEAVLQKHEQERTQLRQRHGVRLVQGAEEGEVIKYLNGGLYGFTYAPATTDTGLFARRAFLSFEVHKLADYSIHILGCVTPAAKAAIESRTDTIEIEFWPEPYGEATELILLPLALLAHSRQPVRGNGSMIKTLLRPRS